MSYNLMTGCSAYSLKVKREAPMPEHALSSHLHSGFLQVSG